MTKTAFAISGLVLLAFLLLTVIMQPEPLILERVNPPDTGLSDPTTFDVSSEFTTIDKNVFNTYHDDWSGLQITLQHELGEFDGLIINNSLNLEHPILLNMSLDQILDYPEGFSDDDQYKWAIYFDKATNDLREMLYQMDKTHYFKEEYAAKLFLYAQVSNTFIRELYAYGGPLLSVLSYKYTEFNIVGSDVHKYPMEREESGNPLFREN